MSFPLLGPESYDGAMKYRGILYGMVVIGILGGSRLPFASHHHHHVPKVPLGALAISYESSGGGVKTVSSGKGDPGGVSYGRFQIDSRSGTMAAFLVSPEGRPFAKYFKGFQSGSDKFSEAYLKLSKTQPKALGNAEQRFIFQTHYEPALHNALQLGFKVKDRGLQEAIYSGAVQHGRFKLILEQAASSAKDFPDLSARDQIKLLYQAREQYVMKHVSHKIRPWLIKRYKKEMVQALKISEKYNPETKPS